MWAKIAFVVVRGHRAVAAVLGTIGPRIGRGRRQRPLSHRRAFARHRLRLASVLFPTVRRLVRLTSPVVCSSRHPRVALTQYQQAINFCRARVAEFLDQLRHHLSRAWPRVGTRADFCTPKCAVFRFATSCMLAAVGLPRRSSRRDVGEMARRGRAVRVMRTAPVCRRARTFVSSSSPFGYWHRRYASIPSARAEPGAWSDGRDAEAGGARGSSRSTSLSDQDNRSPLKKPCAPHRPNRSDATGHRRRGDGASAPAVIPPPPTSNRPREPAPPMAVRNPCAANSNPELIARELRINADLDCKSAGARVTTYKRTTRPPWHAEQTKILEIISW